VALKRAEKEVIVPEKGVKGSEGGEGKAERKVWDARIQGYSTVVSVAVV